MIDCNKIRILYFIFCILYFFSVGVLCLIKIRYFNYFRIKFYVIILVCYGGWNRDFCSFVFFVLVLEGFGDFSVVMV